MLNILGENQNIPQSYKKIFCCGKDVGLISKKIPPEAGKVATGIKFFKVKKT